MKTLIEFNVDQLAFLCQMTEIFADGVRDISLERLVKLQQGHHPDQLGEAIEEDVHLQKLIKKDTIGRHLLERFEYEHKALKEEIERAEKEGRATEGTLSPSLAAEVLRLQGELPNATRMKLKGMEARLRELLQRIHPTLEWVSHLREQVESTDEQAEQSTDAEGPLNAPLSEA